MVHLSSSFIQHTSSTIFGDNNYVWKPVGKYQPPSELAILVVSQEQPRQTCMKLYMCFSRRAKAASSGISWAQVGMVGETGEEQVTLISGRCVIVTSMSDASLGPVNHSRSVSAKDRLVYVCLKSCVWVCV